MKSTRERRHPVRIFNFPISHIQRARERLSLIPYPLSTPPAPPPSGRYTAADAGTGNRFK